ncbi:unnamed protein product [Rhodiola kirilowii]
MYNLANKQTVQLSRTISHFKQIKAALEFWQSLSSCISGRGGVCGISYRLPFSIPFTVDQDIGNFLVMAYIPPHKRHTRDTDKPDPKPALLAPQFRKNLSLGSSSSSFNRKNDRDKPMGWNIKYPNSAVFRWFAVGLTNDDVLPFPVSLQLVPSGIVKSKDGERLILVNTEVEKTTEVGSTLKSPWVIIAENVLPDLLSSFLAVRNENENNDFGKALVARIGKIMFHRTSSVNIETGDNNALPLSTLRNLKKTFYTNLPSSYLENITTGVAQEVGLEVEDEKERYLIQLYDKEQPDATIFCKCKVTPDGRRLELLKPGFCDQVDQVQFWLLFSNE